MTYKQQSVDEIVEKFWGKFAWCDLQNSEDSKRINDWLTQTLQAERERQEELVEALVEQVAKAIYDQFSYTENGVKPKWVEKGNSLKQDEARKLAREALTTPKNPQ